MVRETAYDEVFDSQKHYRSILDSMARPGKINRLEPVELAPPPGLNRASSLAAFALLDGDTTFETVQMEHGEASYLAANTRAVRTGVDDAAFIFADGNQSPDMLEAANCGTLTYPDTAATLVLQISTASQQPLTGGLGLSLEGPGIEGTGSLFVRGLNPDLLLALQARNAEFPLGLDTILTFEDEAAIPYVVGLPRTARVSWEPC